MLDLLSIQANQVLTTRQRAEFEVKLLGGDAEVLRARTGPMNGAEIANALCFSPDAVSKSGSALKLSSKHLKRCFSSFYCCHDWFLSTDVSAV